MYKTEITYEDFDGNTITEPFYFNLSKAELLEMQMMYPEGYEIHLKRLLESGNRKGMIEAFKSIIAASYGERSDDGKKFIKSPEISSAFMTSEAYSALFIRMCTEEDYAEKFISAIIPKELTAQVDRANMQAVANGK